jgi:heme A synthase
MGGRLVPAVWAVPTAVHFAHRVLAGVVFGIVLVVAARAHREAPRTPAAALAGTAAALFLAQILIGAANVWSRLADAAIVAHVTVAALAWGALVATAASTRLDRSGDRVAAPVGGAR